ncbi:FadR/GntR family transcriptional regulator [Pseudohoeflea coraliihabitans]|uniref:FCD domain-containing protein n=1 Tax=Pseudohoeflea coraliihabitans TaxID=2860393 RepID=A0ABS6WP64_9HYPH|nr:FCD domain-containing protein [Pseudohoeflea sp. DP4N28-3]MBW3097550.1 FCD domain-containing protein [Pseudohoeflea sp. DP4N28-3]
MPQVPASPPASEMVAPQKLRNIVSTAGTTRDFLAIVKRLAGASPAEILGVRLIIEPLAAATAVSSATGADLKGIRAAHTQAVMQSELTGFEHWDAELHSRIYAATRNELLISLNALLGDIRTRAPWIRLKRKVITDVKRREYCGHHEAIVDAITQRDSEGAKAAMHRHISIIIDDLFPK